MKYAFFTHHLANLLPRFGRQALIASAASVAFAATAFAQDAAMVTLKYDDGEGITGELVQANDQGVVLRSSIGLVTVPVDGVTCIGQACPASMRFVSSAPQLKFTTLDGSVEVSGQLIEIANDQYVIATNLGELRISVDGAICEGEGCPATSVPVQLGGDVVLRNGATVIEGKLVGVEGAAYIVDAVSMGVIRVDSGLFDCTGGGCP